MSAAAAEAASLFMSKFEVETGSGEVDDVFKSMDAECKACMQETKVRHQVAFFKWRIFTLRLARNTSRDSSGFAG